MRDCPTNVLSVFQLVRRGLSTPLLSCTFSLQEGTTFGLVQFKTGLKRRCNGSGKEGTRRLAGPAMMRATQQIASWTPIVFVVKDVITVIRHYVRPYGNAFLSSFFARRFG